MNARRITWSSLIIAAVLAPPAYASPGSVSVTEGGMEFRAGANTSNVVRIGGSFGTSVWDFAAPVIAGDGCVSGTPITCSGAPSPTVRLLNGNDLAYVDGSFADVLLYGGAGDDDVHAGSANNAYAWGDDGDDTIRLNAGNAGFGYGGKGDDQIAGSLGENGDQLHGGPGDDLLVSSGSYGRDTSFGEAGGDRLVHDPSSPPADRLDGGDGGDIIVGRAFEIVGGKGTDAIVADPGVVATVTGGMERDDINVIDDDPSAGADSVNCGSGVDSVYADANDVVAANCEQVVIGSAPAFDGVAQARADAAALQQHQPAVPPLP
jgi:hypothetical protein